MVSFSEIVRGVIAIVIGKELITMNFTEIHERFPVVSVDLVPRLYNQFVKFEEWRNQSVGKSFSDINNVDEYFHTLSNWVDNDNYIRDMNAKGLSYELGHGPFSGLNQREFSQFLMDRAHNKVTRPYAEMRIINKSMLNLPAAVDWTTIGAVTGVKDQGQCGSCWSFSTTGAMEGAYFIKTGKLVSFSEQQLVDCDIVTNGGSDLGCKGGLMDSAFEWIQTNNGICSETSYPYVSGTTTKSGKCQTKCANVAGTDVSKFVDIEPNSDIAMMTVLAERPVSIAIEADQKDFQLYKSGVFTGDCGATLDHGVLVVGYGTQGTNDFYKVKNSWGPSWGLNGYILLGRGTDPVTGKPYNKGSGQCGILAEASYPLLAM